MTAAKNAIVTKAEYLNKIKDLNVAVFPVLGVDMLAIMATEPGGVNFAYCYARHAGLNTSIHGDNAFTVSGFLPSSNVPGQASRVGRKY